MALRIESKSVWRLDTGDFVGGVGLATDREADGTRLVRFALPMAALALAPTGAVLLRHTASTGVFVEFLLVGLVLGGAAAAVILARVPRSRAGRAELGLRVLATASMLTAVTAAFGALSAPHASALHGGRLAASWCIAAGVLTGLAIASWFGGPTTQATRPIPPLCALVKRSVDVVVASAGLLLTLPVLVLAAVAISRESEGGWLFGQTRLGERGTPFRFYKLRTMIADNDDSQHRAHMMALISGHSIGGDLYGKPVDDPRRTAVGAFLRRLSIDELPQLWNVIKGDMSLVGPRPPLPWEAELYDDRAWQRLAGKPGITGLWQVEGRGRIPFSEMVNLDVLYLHEWSPLMELGILARTPKAALWNKYTA